MRPFLLLMQPGERRRIWAERQNPAQIVLGASLLGGLKNTSLTPWAAGNGRARIEALQRRLENGPFYARSLVETRWRGEPVVVDVSQPLAAGSYTVDVALP